MQKLTTLIVLMGCFGCAHQHSVSFDNPQPNAVAYRIEYLESEPRAFRVTLRFKDEGKSETRIRLPNEWAGIPELFKGLYRMEAISPGTVIANTDKPHIKLIRHAPAQVVELRYEIRQSFDGPLDRNVKSWPVLAKDYFYFSGHGFFVMPDWDVEASREISIQWLGIPHGWRFANSFGVNEHFQTPIATLFDLEYGLYIGGDFRIAKKEYRGQTYHLATRGTWKFADEQLNQTIATVVENLRDFWNDHSDRHFLMVTLPVVEKSGRVGGEGYTHGFAALWASQQPIDEVLRHILWHEFGHRWIGMQIVPAEPSELYRWFYEGFSDYYARLFMLRSGQYSLPAYIENYNKTLAAYYSSPVREASNARIKAEEWKNEDMSRLPYYRGEILAHDWNARIKKASHARQSLDDVMRVFLREGQEKKQFDFQAIRRIFKPFLGVDLQAEIARHVDHGVLIYPRRDALGPCVRLGGRKVYSFDPGFDLEKLHTMHVITGVRTGSNAYKAGLRNGQMPKGLSSYDLKAKNGDEPILVTVESPEGRREIRYQPSGTTFTKVPAYVLDEAAFQKNARRCLDWFK